MTRNPQQPHALTVGDLCRAIAEGQLPATLHKNQWYQVSARDVRRLANHRRIAPAYGWPLPTTRPQK